MTERPRRSTAAATFDAAATTYRLGLFARSKADVGHGSSSLLSQGDDGLRRGLASSIVVVVKALSRFLKMLISWAPPILCTDVTHPMSKLSKDSSSDKSTTSKSLRSKSRPRMVREGYLGVSWSATVENSAVDISKRAINSEIMFQFRHQAFIASSVLHLSNCVI